MGLARWFGTSAQVAPANGPYNVRGPVTTRTGAPAGSFTGVVRNLSFTATANDTLTAAGRLSGTITQANGTTRTVVQEFTGMLVAQRVSRTCEILNLDLGPINLDLLGLIVNISPINQHHRRAGSG